MSVKHDDFSFTPGCNAPDVCYAEVMCKGSGELEMTVRTYTDNSFGGQGTIYFGREVAPIAPYKILGRRYQTHRPCMCIPFVECAGMDQIVSVHGWTYLANKDEFIQELWQALHKRYSDFLIECEVDSSIPQELLSAVKAKMDSISEKLIGKLQ